MRHAPASLYDPDYDSPTPDAESASTLHTLLLPPDEREYAASNIFAFFAHLAALILILAWLPPLRQPFDQHIPQLLTRVAMDAPVDPVEELTTEDPETTLDDTTAAAAGGEEGRFGADDALVEDSVLPDHDGPLTDRVTTELGTALHSAIARSGALTNVFGQSNRFSDAMGTDFATAGVGDAFVMGRGVPGAMGRNGNGPGGGGDGPGRVRGVGELDTGAGTAQRASVARRQAVERRTSVVTSAPRVGNFCSRENIQRVVARHSRAVRSCYEAELGSSPDLSGRITASWTIGLEGTVVAASVTESTIGSRNMESCLLHEVRRMRFDRPEGGQCVVSFPYTFRTE